MFDESGGDNKSRVDEARKLLSIIQKDGIAGCTQKDMDFIEGTRDRLERYGDKTFISPRQIFWLRDLKDRSL